MRTRPLKNVAASVRDRLLTRSRETGEETKANILETEIVAQFSEITDYDLFCRQILLVADNLN